MLPKSLLNTDDDWQESARRKLYPRLHDYLKKFGGYGIGIVTDSQYVCSIEAEEDAIEKELYAAGFIRNPISSYKTHPDGRKSEGSWVMLYTEDATGQLSEGRQLHFTLMPRREGKGRDIYAHIEYDWRVYPLRHLREIDFDAEGGAKLGKRVIDNHTYFNVKS